MTVVAYLVTSHTLPGQLLRLVRTIRTLSPAAPVLVHHDARREPLDRPALEALGGVRLVPPEPVVEWGRASRLDMLLRCWRFALTHEDFDWLALVSGQDYPVRPLDAVERELAGTAFDGFVEGHVVDPPAWRRDVADEFARRYFYRWREVPAPGRLARRAVVAGRPLVALRELPSGTMLGRRCRTPFTAELPCRRGSDWPTLSRRCVAAVDRAARERPGLLAHFRRTLCPDEAFAPTVLHADADLRLSGDSRRFMSWPPGNPSPDVLRSEHLDAILTSGTDFARKFDERVDAAVLDALDRHLGVRQGTQH